MQDGFANTHRGAPLALTSDGNRVWVNPDKIAYWIEFSNPKANRAVH